MRYSDWGGGLQDKQYTDPYTEKLKMEKTMLLDGCIPLNLPQSNPTSVHHSHTISCSIYESELRPTRERTCLPVKTHSKCHR